MTLILPDIKVVPEDKREICGVCSGSGESVNPMVPCWKCRGTGEIMYNQNEDDNAD